jgi:hypothetical protein
MFNRICYHVSTCYLTMITRISFSNFDIFLSTVCFYLYFSNSTKCISIFFTTTFSVSVFSTKPLFKYMVFLDRKIVINMRHLLKKKSVCHKKKTNSCKSFFLDIPNLHQTPESENKKVCTIKSLLVKYIQVCYYLNNLLWIKFMFPFTIDVELVRKKYPKKIFIIISLLVDQNQ